MGWLEGQIALVTGGASGIGRAVVERFVEEGANVVVLDRAAERFDRPPGWEGRVQPVTGDVTRIEDNAEAVRAALETFGSLDVLVANAGITDAFTPLAELDGGLVGRAFDELFAVNVKGVLLGVKAAMDALVASRGCVIVTLSNSSFYPDGGGPLYVASKHAALGLVRQLAHELAPVVRVNGVAPGGTPTDIRMPPAFGLDESNEPRRAQDVPDLDRMIESVTPLQLAAAPADHAGAYVLLACRRDARAMTGAVIETDAGLGVRGIRRVRGGEELGVLAAAVKEES